MKIRIFLIGVLSLLWMEVGMAMALSSPDFSPQATVPVQYTCEGKNVQPELQWSQAPVNTQSFVMIFDDPDYPPGTWTHWVVFNIPKDTQQLEAGEALPAGALLGENSWGNTEGYRGPCPPTGTHRYIFTIYALDTVLQLPAGAKVVDVRAAMKDHVLAQAAYMGKYKKQKQ